jgi:polyhydroxyalkanoate synthase
MSPERPLRRGPRPLPLHLATSWLVSTSSLAALPLARHGSLRWSEDLAAAGESLASALAKAEPEALGHALATEVRRRLGAVLAGVESYRHHPYERRVEPTPAVWEDGTTRLLDYGPESGVPALFVPSLINRAYILDLERDRSLLRHLAGRGIRPLLVDWDAPGEAERSFTLTDYVVGRLEGALEATRRLAGRKPAVVGYCMGGLLALALAQRRSSDIAGLALLATPWDFHAGTPAHTRLFGAAPIAAFLRLSGILPVDMLQALLASLDPNLVPNKLRAFARLDPASPEACSFVALEDWLNDGVDLAGPVAEECLVGWYGENRPERGRWRIAGAPVLPERYGGPALVVVPARDRIVPPASAEALVRRMPHATVHRPLAGHIGMVVGRSAEAALWRPLGDWLAATAA